MHTTEREGIRDTANPLELDGIEFIEHTATKPQALGQGLEMMGFNPVACHRSREVRLYRQGSINVNVNVSVNAHIPAMPGSALPSDKPMLAVIALGVRDAADACKRALTVAPFSSP